MAALAPSSAPGRRGAGGAAVLAAVSVPGLAWLGATGPGAALRDWWPLGLMLLGYWLPALLVTAPDETLERSLLAFDDRVIGRARIAALVERGPRVVVELLELAYLCCYPLVPAGLACLYLAGLHGRADQFWTAVLVAAFGSYGTLPWFSTRPPRTIEAAAGPIAVRRQAAEPRAARAGQHPVEHVPERPRGGLARHRPRRRDAPARCRHRARADGARHQRGKRRGPVPLRGGRARRRHARARRSGDLAARLRARNRPWRPRLRSGALAVDRSRGCLRDSGCASW